MVGRLGMLVNRVGVARIVKSGTRASAHYNCANFSSIFVDMKEELISAFKLTLIPDKDSIQRGTDALSAIRKNAGNALVVM